MPNLTARANGKKSKIRARVERVFAQQRECMGSFIRSIGIHRSRAKITMASIAYNSAAGDGGRGEHAIRLSLGASPMRRWH